jgi:hypothetical protein
MKKCSHCKKYKELSEFYGMQHRCKVCTDALLKIRRKRLRSEGKCWHCGKKTDINPKTNLPFAECKARRNLKKRYDKKRTEYLYDCYILNNLGMKRFDNPSEELLNFKREQIRLFRISRGGMYEKYV